MALTPRSGYSITTSDRNDIPGEIPNTQPDLIANMPFVTDTLLNKYAIDTSQYPNMTNMMAGFAKGHRVSVTYYRSLNQGGSNNRSNIADWAAARNIIDSEYQKILNLEITLPSGFVFASDPNSASISISGQALFYPNMNPNIGDVFLMGTGDGRIGLARISSVAPLNWTQNRFYAVNFVIQSFADAGAISVLDGASTIISVFTKTNYLGGGAALLCEQTYVYLEQIKAIRTNLCRYFHNTFFYTDFCSYMRPDGLYDPFVVQFMAGKITLNDVNVKPKNMLGKNPGSYNQSIWARLEDRYNTTLYGVIPYETSSMYNETLMGVFVTELVGYWVVNLTPDSTYPPYVFSNNFYTNNQVDMTAFELLMYNGITQRTCGDLGTLITTYLDTVFVLDQMTQFYNIPLYIHLIDMALQSQYREIDSPTMDFATNGG